MRKWLVTVIKHISNDSRCIGYRYVTARTKKAAINKAHAELAHALVPTDIINVTDSIDINALRTQIAQAEREVANAEEFLRIATNKYFDLCYQLQALKD